MRSLRRSGANMGQRTSEPSPRETNQLFGKMLFGVFVMASWSWKTWTSTPLCCSFCTNASNSMSADARLDDVGLLPEVLLEEVVGRGLRVERERDGSHHRDVVGDLTGHAASPTGSGSSLERDPPTTPVRTQGAP